MDRSQKEQVVTNLRALFSECGLLVVTHQVGLTVAEATELRRRMRGAGAVFRVTKNRLARRALEGTPFEGLAALFVGPTAIACSEDPVAAARVAVDYAKDSGKLVILGGALGDKALDVAGVEALARLPSLDELRAKIAALLNSPATRLAAVLQAPAGQLGRVFAARGEQGEGA